MPASTLTAADLPRIDRQHARVRSAMLDGKWRTLAEISTLAGAPEASASARLRDLRRAGWTVERRRRNGPTKGTHEYRPLLTQGRLPL